MPVLPENCKIIWVATHGASFWAISTKIDVELEDGSPKSYFMKVYITPKGEAQVLGEYVAAGAVHAIIPENVPPPVGKGVLARDNTKHFLVFEFVDMVEEMPPVNEFVNVLARLHKNSHSPNGKFGFDVPTSQTLQLTNAWCDTWEEFYTRMFLGTVHAEQVIQGPHAELMQLAKQVCEKVIPRLLRPMEIEGRKLKPTLVHGDLWHGNVAINLTTDQVVFFDCCSFYGHHEYELCMFRAARYRTNKSHVRAYHKLMEVSYPEEDHDDRNALYALRVDLDVSCAWSANKRMRLLAIEEMQRLVDKYPDGFEGWQAQRAAVAASENAEAQEEKETDALEPKSNLTNDLEPESEPTNSLEQVSKSTIDLGQEGKAANDVEQENKSANLLEPEQNTALLVTSQVQEEKSADIPVQESKPVDDLEQEQTAALSVPNQMHKEKSADIPEQKSKSSDGLEQEKRTDIQEWESKPENSSEQEQGALPSVVSQVQVEKGVDITEQDNKSVNDLEQEQNAVLSVTSQAPEKKDVDTPEQTSKATHDLPQDDKTVHDLQQGEKSVPLIVNQA